MEPSLDKPLDEKVVVDTPPQPSPPPSAARILARMFGAMMAGLIVLLILYYLIFGIHFLWAPTSGGKVSIIFLFHLLELAGSGFVTGVLLCRLCPRQNRLHPAQLFLCSPVIVSAVYVNIILFVRIGTHGLSFRNGPARFMYFLGRDIFFSWIGALAGWGVYSLITKKNR